MKKFKLNYYGKSYELILVKEGNYKDGSIAVSAIDAKTCEPFADITTCAMINRDYKENEAFVKCYGENSFVLEFLLKNKIADYVLENGNKVYATLGYCVAPLMKFDMDKINK